MFWFYDIYDALTSFMDTGGPVLWFIALLLLAMWSLVFERVWYFGASHRKLVQHVVNDWNTREDIKSWRAHRIREAIISRVNLQVDQNLRLIKTMVTLCPLLGLLGTVTGMIEVFNIMAVTGGGDAKSMAGGVSRATIPTMAGMVAALSGVFANTYLMRVADRQGTFLEDNLTTDH